MTSTYKTNCTSISRALDCAFAQPFQTPPLSKHIGRHLASNFAPRQKNLPTCSPMRGQKSVRGPNQATATTGFRISFKENLKRPRRFLEDSPALIEKDFLTSPIGQVNTDDRQGPDSRLEFKLDGLLTLEESAAVWGSGASEDEFDFNVRFETEDQQTIIDSDSELDLSLDEEEQRDFTNLERDLVSIEFDDLQLVLERGEESTKEVDLETDLVSAPICRNLMLEFNAAAEEHVSTSFSDYSFESDLERRVSALNDSEILNLQEIRDRKKVSKSAPKPGSCVSLEPMRRKLVNGTVHNLLSSLNLCVSGVTIQAKDRISKKAKMTHRSLDFQQEALLQHTC